MARQSIPRFDLYAELGVDPSADDQAVEAAYHALVERHLSDVAGSDKRVRLRHLNVARDWLSDSELRSRYNASRSRAAARAARGTPASRRAPSSTARTTTRKPAARRAKAPAAATAPEAAATEAAPAREATAAREAAATGLTAIEAAEAEAMAAAEAKTASDATTASDAIAWAPAAPAPPPSPELSWPAVDLERWAPRVAPRRRRSPGPVAVIAALATLVAVVGVVAFAAIAIWMRPASSDVAVASPTTPAQTTIVETPSPQPAPTIAPATPVVLDFAAQQLAAWDTIQALAADAKVGDVSTAQTMLGDTAPGLRSSGLKRAVFPDIEAAGISVTLNGASYIAIAGTDRLTSTDGVTWTFDYADRPLRAYKPPIGEPVHDLWWMEPDGRHDLYLRVTLATISKSGVTAKLVWSYAADRPDDATYFGRATLLISSLILDDTPTLVTAPSMPMLGVTTLTTTATFTGVGAVPDRLELGITVNNPSTVGGSDRAIESIFSLTGR